MYEISQGLINQLVKYLTSKPYAEVVLLLSQLDKELKACNQGNEEVKDKPETLKK